MTSTKRFMAVLTAVILTLITSITTAHAPMNDRITFLPTINVKTLIPKEDRLSTVETPNNVIDAIYEVTQYTANYESTQKRPGDKGYGITSSGVKATANHTAACAKTIPYGSTVYIPELDATYVCEDTGNAITDGHIDIYVKSVKAAKRFGRREMNVIITQK